MTDIEIDCFWLPPSHGGRRFDPQPGLRLGIRWQRHVYEYQDIYRDLEIVQLSVDPSSRQGVAAVRLVSEVPSDWLRHGELVEILEGFQVVAVGFISREEEE